MRLAFIVMLSAFSIASADAVAPPPPPLSPEVRALLDETSTKIDSDSKGAVAAAEKAAELDPDSSEVQLWLGRAWGRRAQEASLLAKPGAAKKCRVAFERAVELDPGNVDARAHLVDFYTQAPGMMGGSDEKALQQVAAIAELDPVRAHLARSSIARHKKDLDGVERELRAAAATEPAGGWAGRSAFANFLLEQKRPEEARGVWQQVLEATPRDPMATYQLGRLASITGQHLEEAVELFKTYLATTPGPGLPTWADANWRLGQVYEKLGRKGDAVAAWRESLRLNPSHAQAKADFQRITKG